jgi:HEAT repeat protein
MSVQASVRTIIEHPEPIDISPPDYQMPPAILSDLVDEEHQRLAGLPVAETLFTLLDIYLHGTESTARSRAYSALVRHPALDSVVFLSDAYQRLGVDICHDLGAVNTPQARAKLCQILVEDPDASVRCEAAEVLAAVGDTQAIPFLEHARDHDTGVDYANISVAHTAAQALEAIHSRLITPRI